MEQSPSWEANSHSSIHKFYGTWRFINVFTRVCHWSLSWSRCIHSIPSQYISLRSVLILSPIYTYVFRVVSFLQVFQSKYCIFPYLSHTCYMPRSSHCCDIYILWKSITNMYVLIFYKQLPFVTIKCGEAATCNMAISCFINWYVSAINEHQKQSEMQHPLWKICIQKWSTSYH